MANAAAGCFIICSTPDRYDMAMVMAGVTSMHTSSCAQDFFIFVGAKDSASGASMCKDRRGDGQASSYDTQYALLGIYLLCILLITNRSTKQIGAMKQRAETMVGFIPIAGFCWDCQCLHPKMMVVIWTF